MGNQPLVIEGAGGLFVPLNDRQFIIDLIQKLDATVLLVSRNYLGSINHSLLTAAACRRQDLRVAGWIFNDQYMRYEQEIAQWTGIPAIASIPFRADPQIRNLSGSRRSGSGPRLQAALQACGIAKFAVPLRNCGMAAPADFENITVFYASVNSMNVNFPLRSPYESYYFLSP
jgi:hypothetical protein